MTMRDLRKTPPYWVVEGLAEQAGRKYKNGLDRPWVYMGEFGVMKARAQGLRAVCPCDKRKSSPTGKCWKPEALPDSETKPLVREVCLEVITLEGRGDNPYMLAAGRCGGCGKFYWAKLEGDHGV